jgi:alpha-ribazole phosphatase
MVNTLWLWRHPRAMGAGGRCIGRTDLRVDPRRSKRLAHRVRATARRHGLARLVFTSPLARCHAVGAWLARWGWRHVVDTRLLELDFGDWDGRPWPTISEAEVTAWSADLLHHPPGGGEPLAKLLERVQSFCADAPPDALAITHAGWMQALQLLSRADAPITAVPAAAWPAPPAHGSLRRISLEPRDPAPTMKNHLVAGTPPRDHAGGAVPSCPDSMSSPSGSNGSCSGTRN